MVQEKDSLVRRLAAVCEGLMGRSVVARTLSHYWSAVLLLLLLLAEAGVFVFVTRDLARSYATVENMYSGSVQGLARFGELEYQAQETRRSTLYALSTNDGNLQVNYADQSRNADKGVTQGIAQYLEHARTADQIQLAQRLMKDWNAYLNVRDKVLGLILEGSTKEAVETDISLGVPEFDRVRQDLEEMKRTYDEGASRQVAAVAEFSRASIWRLTAGLGCGLLFGMLAIWAIQKSRMHSAVQLAKLQMDFVAFVSHELRTPITAILTAGENVRDGLAVGRDHLSEHGSVITDQATRLMELVDQVLLFSAASKSALSHPFRELRVDELIAHALRSTQPLLDAHKFTVEQKIAPDLPSVIGDLAVLSQCLENLIVNAVKYGSANRWIGISARMNGNNEVLISIRDRGIGIAASEVEHIFDPFYRSPDVVAAQIHGTGLGLSIAKRSAEIFGGSISVSSEVGVGSTFTVSLPSATEPLPQTVVSSNPRIGTYP